MEFFSPLAVYSVGEKKFHCYNKHRHMESIERKNQGLLQNLPGDMGRGRILTPEGFVFICEICHYDTEATGRNFIETATKLKAEEGAESYE